MKLACIALAALATSAPALAAQTTAEADVLKAAQQLAMQRHDAYPTKDAAAIGRQFDPNGVFVRMQPTVVVEQGPQGVEQYFQRLFARSVTDVNLHFTNARVLPNGDGMAWGSYDITGAGKTVQGHIFEVLKKEAGEWKIMVHAIARPEDVGK